MTPKGKDWHRPQAARRETPERQERKLADLAKRRAAQERRRQAMTPDELAAHAEWHRTHRPGPQEAREAARERRRQDREARALVATPAPAQASAAAVRLDREIARLEAERAMLAGEGVFG